MYVPNPFKMFEWMNFRGEPKKATPTAQAFEVTNMIFRRFFCTGSWIVYFLALVFLVIGVSYFFVDESIKNAMLERRRQIRRAHERPPQRRRPGAVSRNHEIYRSVMGQVKEYIEPNINQICVFRQNSSGTIYGEVIGKNQNQTNHDRNEILNEKKQSGLVILGTENRPVFYSQSD